MQTSIPCVFMRGGTSRGPFFLASDLPDDPATRDKVLLAVMGSPDDRQIDGLGGADPLTSKAAIVGPSTREDCDVDYLVAQVVVTEAVVDVSPNCGNMLAGIGPFAIEHGLVPAQDGETEVRIHMVNSGDKAVARIMTPGRTACSSSPKSMKRPSSRLRRRSTQPRSASATRSCWVDASTQRVRSSSTTRSRAKSKASPVRFLDLPVRLPYLKEERTGGGAR